MSSMSWIGQSIGGRYRVESLLGQGGMSAVYKATDPNLRRTVAVKLIHSHLSSDPEFVRRFEQEAAAVAQLRHPNIIQVFDFAHDAEVYYMVLEYVAGETLQARLKALHASEQRLPLADAVRIMATICDAVAYAHRRGMIHRDLKPANVMLDAQAQPILMDFGVAKMVGGTQHTATGAIMGTVAYMSPEQIRGARVDERADIYSLGIMLYEMAAGRPPFEGDSAMTVMFKQVNEPPPDISQFNAEVPERLKAIINKALAKEPADRFQTAAEMATALRALTPEPAPPAQPRPAPPVVPIPSVTIDQPAPSTAPAMPPVVAPAPQPSPPDKVVASTLEAAPIVTTPPTPAPMKTDGAPIAAPLPRKSGLPLGWLIGAGALGLLVIAAIVAGVLIVPRLLGGAAPTDLPQAEGMAHIAGGVYLVGLNANTEEYAPPQQVTLPEFWIDRHEVTNAQYAEFLRANNTSAPVGWIGGQFPAGQDNRPVQGVTWAQASDYCNWARKRLPTEAEWEVAARGPSGFLYPWGNNEKSVTLPRDGTYDVGSTAANRSYFGAFDMAGNVWEWVAEPYASVPAGAQVLRGGAYNFLKDMAYRLVGDPNLPTMIAEAGFRCAAPQVSNPTVAETAAPLPTEVLVGMLYVDEFANPNSGWPIGSDATHTFGYHPQSFYHIEVAAPNDRLIVTRELGFANYRAETDVLVDHTDTENGHFQYGLVLRRSGEQAYYAFTISPRTQTWQAVRHGPEASQVLAEGTHESIQAGKAVNQLQVEARGSAFTFVINEQTVAQFTDEAYATGEIGFLVETGDETLTHVHFGALRLREVEPVAVAAATATPAPTATSASPTPTETVAPTPEPTATLAPPAGMVLVPGGTFNMGSEQGQRDERPVHAVTLRSFFIDQFEVTNERYRRCVEAGQCTPPAERSSPTHGDYFTRAEFNNFPVIQVTWEQARQFCAAEGKRLPTEAEWEYAARGPEGYVYPWGNEFDASRVPAQTSDVIEVGTLDNASMFDVYDLSGNVAEWVMDWYGPYSDTPQENPTGPERGSQRVFRGGAYGASDSSIYTATRRFRQGPGFHDVDIGFRCAQDVP